MKTNASYEFLRASLVEDRYQPGPDYDTRGSLKLDKADYLLGNRLPNETVIDVARGHRLSK